MEQTIEKTGQLSKEKYKERVAILTYSITFAGSAVAFLITAKEKLGVNISNFDLKIMLIFWGVTVLTGFGEYILSYREVWYHQRLPNGLRKQLIPKIELALLYLVMFIHPISMFAAIIYSIISLWRSIN